MLILVPNQEAEIGRAPYPGAVELGLVVDGQLPGVPISPRAATLGVVGEGDAQHGVVLAGSSLNGRRVRQGAPATPLRRTLGCVRCRRPLLGRPHLCSGCRDALGHAPIGEWAA